MVVRRTLRDGPTRRAPDSSVWLAGHTYAFRALPLAAALERLVALGLHDVELWLGHARDGSAGIASVVRDAGVRVRAISAGGFYASGDETASRAFELAAVLQVELVVLCVAPPLVDELDRLAPPSVRVAVENHWDQPLARSAEVVGAVRRTHLDACLDTGHALAAGERPDRFALRLGRRLAHVHLKEGRLPSIGERVLGRRLRRRLLGKPAVVWPGEGDLDLGTFRASLEQVGYEGGVTLEHEGDRPYDALAALALRWPGA